MDLGKVMDKIQEYDKILEMFGFKEKKGGGIKPWSHRYENEKDQAIEIRSSEWTLYENGEEIIGHKPDELKKHLLEQLSKEELIEINMK